MRQFWEIKDQHTDKILLFRMGDFYEMFYDDAVTAAPILNIALTSRNKKAEIETPMCGVPYHSISTPIAKLLAAGLKVAICEQLEDPTEAKGIVKRGVTKVLSPGMVYDPDTLDEMNMNFVAAYDERSVAFLDASLGKALCFRISSTEELKHYLNLLKPTELLVSSSQRSADQSLWPQDLHLTIFDDLDVEWPEPFKDLSESCYRLLTYAVYMQGPSFLSSLAAFEVRAGQAQIKLSPNLMRHLEIFLSYRGTKEGSLFHALNRTKSSAGTRKFKNWLQFPLMDLAAILSRQEKLKIWMQDPLSLKKLRETMGKLGDLERRISKVYYTSCHPRDLLSLKNALEVALDLLHMPKVQTGAPSTEPIQYCVNLIEAAIHEDPPAQMKFGAYIKKGFSADLDELIDMANNSSKALAELEAREKERTKIPSLKVKFNQVFGYYIEVTNTHKDKVPADYRRKQTLANAERFITDELQALEVKILSAQSRRVQLEEGIFADVRTQIQKNSRAILQVADFLSEVDVSSSLAWLALEQNYVIPNLSEDGDLSLIKSRHPVVEQQVKKAFVANDIKINKGQVLLLTGPNMAGKSTLMRQVALSVIMAQMGGPVPCQAAEMPIFERIFTRIGASDFLSEGLSTFMVEMKESADILKDFCERSLIVLDEVGRGTSTYDGMSLAQAILEHILDKKMGFTLFATHYHELTSLSDNFSSLSNVHMAIAEQNGEIQFLHSLKPGAANRSYGIHVAELAGLPPTVLKRATKLLQSLENKPAMQMSLLDTELAPMAAPQESAFAQKVKSTDVSNLTPLEALNTLHRWQQELS